jgi:hypothetical protein
MHEVKGKNHSLTFRESKIFLEKLILSGGQKKKVALANEF